MFVLRFSSIKNFVPVSSPSSAKPITWHVSFVTISFCSEFFLFHLQIPEFPFLVEVRFYCPLDLHSFTFQNRVVSWSNTFFFLLNLVKFCPHNFCSYQRPNTKLAQPIGLLKFLDVDFLWWCLYNKSQHKFRYFIYSLLCREMCVGS